MEADLKAPLLADLICSRSCSDLAALLLKLLIFDLCLMLKINAVSAPSPLERYVDLNLILNRFEM